MLLIALVTHVDRSPESITDQSKEAKQLVEVEELHGEAD